MSGVRSQHLERRSGIYGFRVRVPDDIRPFLGWVEVRRSLRTSDPFQARAQSALIVARLFKVFEMIRNDTAAKTQNDLRLMVGEILEQVGISIRLGSPELGDPAARSHGARGAVVAAFGCLALVAGR